VVHHLDGVWHWMSDSFPAQEVSLRTAATDNVVIIDQGPPARVVGEIDRDSAPTMVHEEAIYLHEGRQFQVERLDLEEKKAYVRAVDVDYYTDAEQAVKVRILDRFDSERGRGHGEVEVTYLPTIFKKIKLHTHENVGWGKIHLPEDSFHTTAYWLTIPGEVGQLIPMSELEAGLVGVAHVLGQVAPLFLMCDPRDIAVWRSSRRKPTNRRYSCMSECREEPASASGCTGSTDSCWPTPASLWRSVRANGDARRVLAPARRSAWAPRRTPSWPRSGC
jgi:DEAD/DEAH box helicase domain-containing protein